jgi:hypothetical protein
LVNSVIAASIGAALAARITSAATGPSLSESLAGGPPAAVVESKGPLDRGSAPEGSDVLGKVRTISINEAACGDFFGITLFERLFDAVELRQGVFAVEEEFRGDGSAGGGLDSYLRSFFDGNDDCRAIKPGADEAELLTPALSGDVPLGIGCIDRRWSSIFLRELASTAVAEPFACQRHRAESADGAASCRA